MSDSYSPLRRLTTGSTPSPKDKDVLSQLLNNKELSSVEVDIVAKINVIISELRGLEDNFLKILQDLSKKSTIEGRENNKICAVQGNVICNRKKYFKNLEEDIESASKAFQDHFKKINKEINSMSILSKSKTEIKDGSSGKNTSTLISYSLKNPDLPTIRVAKKNEVVRANSCLKDRRTTPFTVRVEPLHEEMSQSVPIPRTEVAHGNRLQTAQNSMLRSALRQMVQKAHLSESIHLNRNDMARNREVHVPANQSFLENIPKAEDYFERRDSSLIYKSFSD